MESELVLPGGPFAGEMYRHYRHPASRLWFAELDSGRWSRCAATAPTQNGKTLMCYVAPVLYHLFEMREKVVVGLPDMNMANDKWEQDFKPVIEASNYRDLMPVKGEGSRGGAVKRAITFRNGATLRFMSGGGGDKKVAGFETRVVAITEVDGMDEPGDTSREADRIKQLEARTKSHGRTGKRIYLECTTSIERGRIWQEIKAGTDSRIARPCPHCKTYVTPEREHLQGWQEAQSEDEAAEQSAFHCPGCGEAWSEQETRAAADRAVLVHRGQEVVDGQVTGPIPKTQTLGFRWSAIDNPFATAADLGAEEWRASRSKDSENAEKEMRQFVWAIPYDPPEIDLYPLEIEQIVSRTHGMARGVVPDGALAVVVQIDTGKRQLHWEAKAVMPDGQLPVIDYAPHRVESDRLGVTRGLIEAFRELRDRFDRDGWSTACGKHFVPSQVWIDSGYFEHTDAVYLFCAEANKNAPWQSCRYRPTKGYGEGQRRDQFYQSPKHRTAEIVYIGKQMHITKLRRAGIPQAVYLMHVDANYWKTQVWQRLTMPPNEIGAITLFDSSSSWSEHGEYASHMTSERQKEKPLPGKGTVTVWEKLSGRANHYLDASYGATAAAEFVRDAKVKAVDMNGSWFERQRKA